MTKVIVNSITIKDTDGSPDPNKLISWDYEKDDEAISEAELILPRSVNDLVDLNNGQVVEIWAGWTTSTDRRYFYGFNGNRKNNYCDWSKDRDNCAIKNICHRYRGFTKWKPKQSNICK